MNEPNAPQAVVAISIAGYDYRRPKVAHSPVTLEELRALEASAGWSEADAECLSRHGNIFRDQAEAMVDTWRAVIASQPALAKWFFGPDGKPDDVVDCRARGDSNVFSRTAGHQSRN